ncbi:MAG: amino acid permease [Fluviicola sp. XM-24bin1]|nr:MAG: amino acid permease [Fluviicola sp. XM-24bin1]
MKAQKYTRSVAINMVIANMIGTGIFTSLGFQLDPVFGIPDGFAIIVIWILGGIIALCGATVYGEIATTINKSGGEYAFLSELYHPLLGFISGWVSILVGFSAAIAMLGLAVGEYFLPLIGVSGDFKFGGIEIGKVVAFLVLLLVLLIQWQGVKTSGKFQNYMTAIKLGLIFFFLLMPFIFGGNYEPSNNHFGADKDSWDTIFSLPFAGSLVFVLFAYSGWNASTYIVGSLENPKRNLPYSLIVGTLIVTVLYVLLNLVFMYVSDFDDLAGQLEIGNIVAYKAMGKDWGLVFTSVLSLALISGVNAMFIAAPRVVQEIGKDYSLFEKLGQESKNGAPKLALLVIFAIASIMIFTVPFNELLEFTGVTLGIFALLTVLGVFILRAKKKRTSNTVSSFLYPITPIIFAGFSIWMIYFFANMKPMVLVWLLILIAPAVLLYYSSGRKNNELNEELLDDGQHDKEANNEVDA